MAAELGTGKVDPVSNEVQGFTACVLAVLALHILQAAKTHTG